MKVKEVIIYALKSLGMADAAQKLEAGAETDKYGAETVETLLYCYNAVEDELARKYLPLSAQEDLESADGEYYYTRFTRAPVKIKRVFSRGTPVDYTLYAQYMRADAEGITVEYEYSPQRKKLDGVCECAMEVGAALLAAGVCAEYCFINGEADAADAWEERYRAAVDKAQTRRGGRIPPRRWV